MVYELLHGIVICFTGLFEKYKSKIEYELFLESKGGVKAEYPYKGINYLVYGKFSPYIKLE